MKNGNGPQIQRQQFAQKSSLSWIQASENHIAFGTSKWLGKEIYEDSQANLRIATAMGVDLKQELFRFLSSYWYDTHCSTDMTPATIMFGRQVQTKLHEIDVPHKDLLLCQQTKKAKLAMKQHIDQYRQTTEVPFRVGDMEFIFKKISSILTALLSFTT